MVSILYILCLYFKCFKIISFKGGLWPGPNKPNSDWINLFIQKCLVDQLKGLFNGKKSYSLTGSVKIYARLLNVVCDKPAKASIRNAIQFNGYYGCSYCEQPGMLVNSFAFYS